MNLTPEQRNKINAFIAEKCGWTNILYHCIHAGVEGFMGTLGGHRDWLPDYCASLDACHEAEKILKGNQWIGYVRLLGEATQEEKGRCHATADQRAIALFQTLGGEL